MKQLTGLMLACLCASAVLVSCSKEEEKKTVPSASEMLVNKDWRLVGYTVASSQVPGGSQDLFMGMQPCEKDDLFRFYTSGDLVVKEGASKCDPADPDSTYLGKWAMIDNDRVLQVINGDTNLLQLRDLTDIKFYTQEVETDNGVTYTFTRTYYKN